MIQQCSLCHHTGLDVESRIVADESPLGYHREPRCIDTEACERRAIGDPDPLTAPEDAVPWPMSMEEFAALDRPRRGCWIFPFLAGLLVMAWRMR